MDDVFRAVKLRTQSSFINIGGRIVQVGPLQLRGEHLAPVGQHLVQIVSKFDFLGGIGI